MDKALHVLVSAALVLGFHAAGWTTRQAAVTSLAIGVSREVAQSQGREGWRDMAGNAVGVTLAMGLLKKDTPYEDAMRLGATPYLLTASDRTRFALTAECLGVSPLVDSTTRVVIGSALPRSWVQFGDEGKAILGYAMPRQRLIFLAPDAPAHVLDHELLHLATGGGHPARYFDGRCGVWRSR